MNEKEKPKIQRRLINFPEDKDSVLRLHEESCWYAYIPSEEMSLEEFRQRMRATGQTEAFLKPLKKAIEFDPQTVAVWETERRIIAYVWVKLSYNDFLDGFIADITEHGVAYDFQESDVWEKIRNYAEELAHKREAYLLRVELGTVQEIELNQWLNAGFNKQQVTMEKQLQPVPWQDSE